MVPAGPSVVESTDNVEDDDSPPPLPPRSATMDQLAREIARRQRRLAGLEESGDESDDEGVSANTRREVQRGQVVIQDGIEIVDAIACPPGSPDYVEALCTMGERMIPPQAVPWCDASEADTPPPPPPPPSTAGTALLVVAEELEESVLGDELAHVPMARSLGPVRD
jgi:hypothetical protein